MSSVRAPIYGLHNSNGSEGTNKFINLKSTLWTVAKYGGPVVLASTIAAPLLAAVGITVAGTVSLGTAGLAVAALFGTVANLNSVEMDTYLAVAAAIERNKMILSNSGASVAHAPVIGQEPTWRLLVALPNDVQGNGFLDSLREKPRRCSDFHFAGTLGEILHRRGVERAGLAEEMRDRFAFLDNLPGYQFAVMNGILRQGCAAKSPNDRFPDIDVGPDQRMRHSAPPWVQILSCAVKVLSTMIT